MEKDIDIKVLSGGCSCCSQLYANVEQAVDELKIDCQPEFVYDINVALKYEVLQMPALIVNEKVISQGSALSVEKIREILKRELSL